MPKWQKGQSGNPAGRPKGALGKLSKAKAEAVIAKGQSPLDFLLSVACDESADMKLRIEAAKAATPYVHPRLASSEVQVTTDDKPAEEMSDAELIAIAGGKVA